MSWKRAILVGLVLGGILGGAAYTYLWAIGNQLEALRHANQTEARYIADMERKLVTEPVSVSEIHLATVMVADGNKYEVQHPQGYRYYFKSMAENDSGYFQGSR